MMPTINHTNRHKSPDALLSLICDFFLHATIVTLIYLKTPSVEINSCWYNCRTAWGVFDLHSSAFQAVPLPPRSSGALVFWGTQYGHPCSRLWGARDRLVAGW